MISYYLRRVLVIYRMFHQRWDNVPYLKTTTILWYINYLVKNLKKMSKVIFQCCVSLEIFGPITPYYSLNCEIHFQPCCNLFKKKGCKNRIHFRKNPQSIKYCSRQRRKRRKAYYSTIHNDMEFFPWSPI